MSPATRPSMPLADQLAELDALMGGQALGAHLSEDRGAHLQALAQAHGLTIPPVEGNGLRVNPSSEASQELAPCFRRAAKRCGTTVAKALACLTGSWGLMAVGIPAGWTGPAHLSDWLSWPCLVVIGAGALIARAMAYGLDAMCATAVEVLKDRHEAALGPSSPTGSIPT